MRTQSNDIGKIVEALSKAQMQFEPIKKDVKSHHGKYAPLDSCYNSTRKSLSENGLTVTQSDVIYEGRNILETTLGHMSGEFFKSYTDLTQLLNNVKGPNPLHEWGKIKTYTRRYAYLLIIGAIGEDEDNDGAEVKNKIQQDPSKLIINQDLTERLTKLIRSSGCDLVEFAKFHKIFNSTDSLTIKKCIDNFDELLIKFRNSKREVNVKEIDS